MIIDDSIYENAIMNEISHRLKEYRISSNLTQEELADKAMISVSTIKRLEKGEDISFYKLISILKALNIESNLEMLVPDPDNSPLRHVEGTTERKRVRKKKNVTSDWKWGDEK